MVNFKKLLEAQTQQPVTDPLEIFRRLPKPRGINDLYTSQAEVLKEWYSRRKNRDVVIKLHTGGGKTLVGLLIAQSVMNESGQPVLYLAPNNQLVEQIVRKSESYDIPAISATSLDAGEVPTSFLNGKKVLVANYNILFTGRSRFGVRGGGREIVRLGAIILDDAHVAFSTMREAFTLRVSKAEDPDAYTHLTTLFRSDFDALSRVGTFDDVVGERSTAGEHTVLEVPYWAWQAKADQVREYLRAGSDDREWPYRFVWPFLRDAFDYCHCLISHDTFVITPLYPLVDMIPTFEECPHRVYMSATIGDDSAIVRTFDADPRLVASPITSNSLAGVSERMILIPEMTKIPHERVKPILSYLAKKVALDEETGGGVVILVPSKGAANTWSSVATSAEATNDVKTYVGQLQDRVSNGPFVFANRYDGIDLPRDACRLLIMDGSPRGASEYDQYRATVLGDSAGINSELAQRIEQGIGRGARGSADYCVVILTGKDLVSRISLKSNQRALTSSTRAQLEMGLQVSEDVEGETDLYDTAMSCLYRNKDWVEYHARELANHTGKEPVDEAALALAAAERRAFQLMRAGNYEQAITVLSKLWENRSSQKGQSGGSQRKETHASAKASEVQEAAGTDGSNEQELDAATRGWLRQYAARIAHAWGNSELVKEYQQRAYADNSNLIRPQAAPPYTPLQVPSKQAEEIVSRILRYKMRRGFMAQYEETVAQLAPVASAHQFEQALSDLGSMLGFVTQRPEKSFGKGPDVLWLLDDSCAWVIEIKSRKKPKNPLTKDEHGQLLNAGEWFREHYPKYTSTRVSVHPNGLVTESTPAASSWVLTLNNLNALIADARQLLAQLCETVVERDELITRCEALLGASTLRPDNIAQRYLLSFEVAQAQEDGRNPSE
ncbi:MAG TPA: DEAD/DEAH box helicase [Chloroflexia bacterium]|jgi:replicative superfamily II helicase